MANNKNTIAIIAKPPLVGICLKSFLYWSVVTMPPFFNFFISSGVVTMAIAKAANINARAISIIACISINMIDIVSHIKEVVFG